MTAKHWRISKWMGLVLLAFLLLACGGGGGSDEGARGSGLDGAGGDDAQALESCHVELFDGDRFGDESIRVQGPGEFPTLDDLPGSDGKSWDDEADSFKYGPDAIVSLWTERHFEGDKTVYDNAQGGAEPSVDEPRSMRIECR